MLSTATRKRTTRDSIYFAEEEDAANSTVIAPASKHRAVGLSSRPSSLSLQPNDEYTAFGEEEQKSQPVSSSRRAAEVADTQPHRNNAAAADKHQQQPRFQEQILAVPAEVLEPEPELKTKPPRGSRVRKIIKIPPRITNTHLNLIKVPPRDYCKIQEHPVRWFELTDGPPVCHLHIQFPASAYVAMAEGFMMYNADDYDACIMNIRRMSAIGYIINAAIAAETVRIREKDELTKQTITRIEDVEKNCVSVMWERVPSAKNPNLFVAYRLHIIEYGNPDNKGLMKELSQLISKNNEEQLAMMRNPPDPAKRPKHDVNSIVHITGDEWKSMCRAYDYTLFTSQNEDKASQIHHKDSPCNPMKVFTMERNVKIAKALGADPQYCNPDTYKFMEHRLRTGHFVHKCVFPEDGKNVWMIDPSDIKPTKITERYFPSKMQDPKHNMAARLRFKQMYQIEDMEEANRQYNRAYGRTAISSEPNDINTLRSRITLEDSELKAMHLNRDGSISSEYYSARLQKARDEWIPIFDSIHSGTGDCPPALQAISAYSDIYNQTNKTLGQIHPLTFKNLSSFANMRAVEAASMNSIMIVLTAHQDVLLFLFSVLHVYSIVPMNINHLLLGPPGIGKSFALLILTKLLLPGTFMAVTYPTAKAFAVPGKVNACMIVIMEDAPSSIYGASGGSGGGGKPGVSSDPENLFKNLLSSLQIIVPTCVYNPTRSSECIVAETGVVVLAAMNESSNVFPPPVLNRHCVTYSAEDNSSDTKGSDVLALMNRVNEPAVKQAVGNLAQFWNRKQVIIAKILHLESSGALHPIDTSAAELVFSILTDVAERQNLKLTKNQRDITRFRLLVRVLVVLHVAYLLFDAPDAPLQDVEHLTEHYLLADKYMFSTVETGIFAIGMLARQWQDETMFLTVETALTCWFSDHAENLEDFKKKVDTEITPAEYKEMQTSHSSSSRDVDYSNLPNLPANEQIGKWLPKMHGEKLRPELKERMQANPAVQEYVKALQEMHEYNAMEESSKMWMYDSVAIGGRLIPAVPGQKPTDDDILSHLAKQLHPRMTKKFLESEIKTKLKQLLNETMPITRVLQTDDPMDHRTVTTEHAKFVVDINTVRIAYPLIKQHVENGADTLFQCVVDTCSIIELMTGQPISLPGNRLLYGECHKTPGKRFIWRHIETKSKEYIMKKYKDYETLARIWNPSYEEPAMQLTLQNMLGSTDPAYFSPQFMRRLFSSDTAFKIMDQNLDSYAALKRAHLLGLTEAEQHAYPSNDPVRCERQIREKDIEDGTYSTMLKYPECYRKTNKQAYKNKIEEDYKNNRNKYLMSTDMDRMRNAQKDFKPVLASMLANIEKHRNGVIAPIAASASEIAAISATSVRVAANMPALERVHAPSSQIVSSMARGARHNYPAEELSQDYEEYANDVSRQDQTMSNDPDEE